MKILITHASAGAGHRKAAEALYQGFKESSHEVTFVDALDYTSGFYKKAYAGFYEFMITRIPFLWAFVFHLINIPPLVPLVRFIRRVQNSINAPKFKKFLIEEEFDCIYSTHFFPTEVAAHLRNTQQIKSRVVTIITDYDVHTIWLAKGVDCFCVATEWTKSKMKKLGIEDQRVVVTGIPTDPKFSVMHDKISLRQKLGLADRFTVLVATGSFGIGPIEEVVNHLGDVQVAVICGHNKHLYDRLVGQKRELVKVNGLVDNMDEWMYASDVMVTKPGGLSISEALVSDLPLIFFAAIPGQEEGNIRVLSDYGVGKSGLSIEEIANEVKLLGTNEEYLKTVRDKTNALASPHAVNDIISIIP